MLPRHHAARLSCAVKHPGNLANCSYRRHSHHQTKRGLRPALLSPKHSITYGNQCRAYATGAEKQVKIAVLGGGITGLASAYFLTQEFPNAQISLFESKEDLGGWVKSQRVQVPGGEVIFESGPRSLRPAPPAGTLTLKVVRSSFQLHARRKSW